MKDYDMDANVSTISRMNKLITSNQLRPHTCLGKKTSLSDENKAKQTKKLKRITSSSKTIGQNESAPFSVSHTMDSELNIVVDELGEAAMVRDRHNPPPCDM